jgi:hypothetical protein
MNRMGPTVELLVPGTGVGTLSIYLLTREPLSTYYQVPHTSTREQPN